MLDRRSQKEAFLIEFEELFEKHPELKKAYLERKDKEEKSIVKHKSIQELKKENNNLNPKED